MVLFISLFKETESQTLWPRVPSHISPLLDNMTTLMLSYSFLLTNRKCEKNECDFITSCVIMQWPGSFHLSLFFCRLALARWHMISTQFLDWDIFYGKTATAEIFGGGKLNELMSLTEFSLSHSYQSKLSKTGSSLDFPSLLFPAHAQYTLYTCSVKGFPSLLCLHMLSPSTQMHSFQGESSPAAKTCIIYRTTVVLQQNTAHLPWKTVHPPICDGKYHWYDSE